MRENTGAEAEAAVPEHTEADLLTALLDPCQFKTDIEWAARGEILRLREASKELEETVNNLEQALDSAGGSL